MLDQSIKLILFDFDGTFGDTAPDLIASANFIYKKYDKSIISFNEGRQIASDGIKAFLNKRFDHSKDNYDKLSTEFLDYYSKHLTDNFKLFDGIEILIHYLIDNNFTWGIVTNKSRKLTEKLLEHIKLADLCSVLVCGDDGIKQKPEPDTILFAMKKLNIRNNETIYLGDGFRDIIAAKRAKIKSILVTYGYLKDDDNYLDWNADYVIEDPREIFSCLQNKAF